MLSLLRRKPNPLAMIEQGASASIGEPARRKQQQNIKVSEDCALAFVALAKAQGLSKAALFEDMVAERLERLQQSGATLELAKV